MANFLPTILYMPADSPLGYFETVPIENAPCQPAWEPSDRAVVGVFTTLFRRLGPDLQSDHIPFWSGHVSRLLQWAQEAGCQRPRPPTRKAIMEWLRTYSASDLLIRLNVSHNGDCWAVAQRLEEPTFIKVVIGPKSEAVEAASPTLSDRKTFHQTWRQRLADFAHNQGAFDVVKQDRAGNLLETTRANLFLKFRTGWVTPPADGQILDGLGRQWVRTLFHSKERAIHEDEADWVEEAFLVNSVRWLLPIHSFLGRDLPTSAESSQLLEKFPRLGLPE